MSVAQIMEQKVTRGDQDCAEGDLAAVRGSGGGCDDDCAGDAAAAADDDDDDDDDGVGDAAAETTLKLRGRVGLGGRPDTTKKTMGDRRDDAMSRVVAMSMLRQ